MFIHFFTNYIIKFSFCKSKSHICKKMRLKFGYFIYNIGFFNFSNHFFCEKSIKTAFFDKKAKKLLSEKNEKNLT